MMTPSQLSRARISQISSSQRRIIKVGGQERLSRRRGKFLVLMISSMTHLSPKSSKENHNPRANLNPKSRRKPLKWPIRKKSKKLPNMRNKSPRHHLLKSRNLRNMRSLNSKRNHLNSNTMIIIRNLPRNNHKKSPRSQKLIKPNWFLLNQNLIKILRNF